MSDILQIADAVYKFYHEDTKDTFFTPSYPEATSSSLNKYQYMGVAFNSPASGTVPVYSFYRPESKRHFFTADEGEYLNLESGNIWHPEGDGSFIAKFHVSATGIPVYRLRNIKSGEYLWEWQSETIKSLVNSTTLWVNEGQAWFVPEAFVASGTGKSDDGTPPSESANTMTITLITYGHDFGKAPAHTNGFDADVRNVDGLGWSSSKTGYMSDVYNYVMGTSKAKAWLARLISWIPQFKNGTVVTIGCSKGHHRSVSIMRAFDAELKKRGYSTVIINRDITKKW